MSLATFCHEIFTNQVIHKIKDIKLQTRKLLGNRRKIYILDAICHIFYFEEVQKEILGQCSRQGILAPRIGLSVYQWYVSEIIKQRGWGWCLCKYSTNVSRFAFDILEKSKLIASTITWKCVTGLGNPKAKKRTPGNSSCILLANSGYSNPFLIQSWKFYMLWLPPLGSCMSSNLLLGFFLE